METRTVAEEEELRSAGPRVGLGLEPQLHGTRDAPACAVRHSVNVAAAGCTSMENSGFAGSGLIVASSNLSVEGWGGETSASCESARSQLPADGLA